MELVVNVDNTNENIRKFAQVGWNQLTTDIEEGKVLARTFAHQ